MTGATPQTRNPADERADAYARLGRFCMIGVESSMGGPIRLLILCGFVRAYLLEHGRFPIGTHQVLGAFRGRPIAFETRFPGPAGAALAAFGHRLRREELWGPPQPMTHEGAFRDAKKQYLQSPERAALSAWLLKQVEQALRDQPAGDPK